MSCTPVEMPSNCICFLVYQCKVSKGLLSRCYPTSTPNAGLELVPNFVLAHDRFFDEFCRSRLLDPLYAPGPGLYRSCLDAGPFRSSVPNVLPGGPRMARAIW